MEETKKETGTSIVILWSLAAIIFIVPVYFAWFHENYTVFDLNKSVALRLFIMIALASAIVFFARSGSYISFKKYLPAKITALVALSFLISSLLSLHPVISLLGSYERQQGFHNYIAYLLFFGLLLFSLSSERKWNRMLIAMLAGTALVCLYGLLQLTGYDFLKWAESSIVRIFSTFGQPNFLGHYLAVVLPLSIYASVFIARRWWWRGALILLSVAELICLLFTYSRSAWLATVVAFGFIIVLRLWHLNFKKTVIGLLLAISAVIVILVTPASRGFILSRVDYSHMNFVGRIVSVLDFNAGSNIIRLKYWGAAWDAFNKAPLYRKLFGFGPDAISSVFVREYQPDWGYYERINSFPDRAHNAPLDALLQFGLVGIGVSLWLLYVCVRPLFANKEREGTSYWRLMALLTAIVAYCVNNFFSFSLTAMFVVWYFLLAMSWTAAKGFPRPELRNTEFFQPISRWAMVIACLALFVVVFFGFNIRPLVADYYYISVKRAEARQDCRVILDDMEKVMEWYPVSHYYDRAYLFHGTNCFSAVDTNQGKQKLAANLLEQAKSIPPREIQFYTMIDMSHAYSVLGYYINPQNFSEAEKYYTELIKENPYITVNYQDYGRMKLWQGKSAEARSLFEQGIAAAPDLNKAVPGSGHTTAIAKQLAYFYDLIGLSYYNEHNFEKAALQYQKALSIDPTLTSSYKQLADMTYQLGNKDEAISYNEKAYAIDPYNSLWPMGLAALWKEKGDFKKALDYAKQANELEPNNEQVKKLLKELNEK